MEIKVERDDRILRAIQEVGDGVLARRHMKELFWPDKTKRAMQKVLSRLYGSGYIDRRTVHYPRISKPRSEPVYWLRWRGILRVVEQMGIEEPYHPKNDGEKTDCFCGTKEWPSSAPKRGQRTDVSVAAAARQQKPARRGLS